jgi:hypothetical protein
MGRARQARLARQPRLARRRHRARSPTASSPVRLCDYRATVGSRRALVGWAASAGAAAAMALALSPAAEALAAKSSIRLRGPKVNTLGARFQYAVSGVAAGRANHLYAWQAPSSPACARTSGAEARRATLALFANRALAGHRRFSLVLRFVARSAEKHRLCAYLVSRRSANTLARAEAAWTNVAPPAPSAGALQPAAVGRGCARQKIPGSRGRRAVRSDRRQVRRRRSGRLRSRRRPGRGLQQRGVLLRCRAAGSRLALGDSLERYPPRL